VCNEVQLNKNFYFLKKNKKEIFAQPYIQNTIKKTIKNDGHDEEFIDFFLFSKKIQKRYGGGQKHIFVMRHSCLHASFCWEIFLYFLNTSLYYVLCGEKPVLHFLPNIAHQIKYVNKQLISWLFTCHYMFSPLFFNIITWAQ